MARKKDSEQIDSRHGHFPELLLLLFTFSVLTYSFGARDWVRKPAATTRRESSMARGS